LPNRASNPEYDLNELVYGQVLYGSKSGVCWPYTYEVGYKRELLIYALVDLSFYNVKFVGSLRLGGAGVQPNPFPEKRGCAHLFVGSNPPADQLI
jgi:hypothetical protein